MRTMFSTATGGNSFISTRPLTLHGDVYVGAGGGLLPRERYASLEIEVRMDLSGWWQNPPTGWTVQDEQVTEVLKLEVNNKDWFEDPEAVTQTVYRRFTLRFCEFTAELGGEDVNPKEK